MKPKFRDLDDVRSREHPQITGWITLRYGPPERPKYLVWWRPLGVLESMGWNDDNLEKIDEEKRIS